MLLYKNSTILRISYTLRRSCAFQAKIKIIKFSAIAIAVRVFTLPDFLAHGGNPYNPGVKVQITKRGSDYITQVAGRIVDTLTPKIQATHAEGDVSGIPGHVNANNIKQAYFKNAESYRSDLIGPNLLQVAAHNIDFDTLFDYKVWFNIPPLFSPRVEFSGTGLVQARQVDMIPVLSFNRTNDGKPLFKISSCEGTFGSLNVLLTDSQGRPPSQLGVQQTTKDLISNTICKEISKIINNDVNRNLQSLASVIPLQAQAVSPQISQRFAPSPSGPPAPGSRKALIQTGNKQAPGASKDFMKDIISRLTLATQNMVLDYRLVDTPSITPQYIETKHKGEISWRGQGGTPLFAQDLWPIDTSSNRMIYIQVSDYLLNSLVFGAFKNNIFKITADENSIPSLAGALRTSCTNPDDILCFGNTFTSISQRYPNHKVQIVSYPIEPPFMGIAPEGIRQNIKGHVDVFGVPLQGGQSVTFFRANCSFAALVRPTVQRDTVTGSISATNLAVTGIESPFDQDSKDTFVDQLKFAVDLIVEKLDEYFKQGIALPKIGFGYLQNPVTKLSSRTLIVESDLVLDEEKLKQIGFANI